jgi:hypothetical protein
MRKALDEEEGLHPNWAHVSEAPKTKIRAGLFASQKWLQGRLGYGSSYHDSSWPSFINSVAAATHLGCVHLCFLLPCTFDGWVRILDFFSLGFSSWKNHPRHSGLL